MSKALLTSLLGGFSGVYRGARNMYNNRRRRNVGANKINRRNRNNYKRRKGLEINNAEGGYKQVYVNSRVESQTVELYVTISLDDNGNYVFNYGAPLQYNIQAALNDNSEFLHIRQNCIQYKVKFISISFNYNRIPAANDKFSKMLITPETDMVLTNSDPKVNKNTMVWDMTKPGTKNYQFRINNRNTEKINNEWQIADSQWNAVMIMHLSSQGYNKIYRDADQPDPTRELGECKISIQILFVRSDTENNAYRITNKDVINYIKDTKYKEIMNLKNLNKEKQITNEIIKKNNELERIKVESEENNNENNNEENNNENNENKNNEQ